MSRHVGRTGKKEVDTGFLAGKPEGRNHLEDLAIDGRLILKLILGK